MLIRAAIENQLARAVREGPQLQAARVAREESVVLLYLGRPFIGERRGPLEDRGDAGDMSLDLDVTRQLSVPSGTDAPEDKTPPSQQSRRRAASRGFVR